MKRRSQKDKLWESCHDFWLLEAVEPFEKEAQKTVITRLEMMVFRNSEMPHHEEHHMSEPPESVCE